MIIVLLVGRRAVLILKEKMKVQSCISRFHLLFPGVSELKKQKSCLLMEDGVLEFSRGDNLRGFKLRQ